jgi:hypothetical protein
VVVAAAAKDRVVADTLPVGGGLFLKDESRFWADDFRRIPGRGASVGKVPYIGAS